MIKSFPRYPQGIHRETGIQVTPYAFGPPALRPSQMNPRFTRSVQGRQLGDTSHEGIDSMNAEGIETYPNELDQLALEDDIVGNGVFDPNLTHGNNHPDAGIFADRVGLPGYIARETFYAPSEVQDLTTGQPVMVVPGGAVAFQQGQEQTFNELINLFSTPPRSEWVPQAPPQSDTWVPQEFSRPVGVDPPAAQASAPWPTWAYLGIGAGVGLGIAFAISQMRRGR